ncbi:lytic transglycosylase domain-containing protein [Citrobacter portucalensis]|uniref:lytic transglycosylase domain-containing protein n=1 Tax=Citrobacter portucalensis TaxID=1639133 RepID=UPI001F1E62B2|nr:lytic transglycosylase domain-containing protein [Citrobacter portucalensis]MCE9797788.1 lytic transglycosylase domain-containing protein [Citrobacter portucalensis]
MIINELAYKVTIKADEFLNGKRKLKDEVKQLEVDFDRSGKNISRTLKSSTLDVTQFGSAAASSFRGAYTAAAGFLGIGAGLYGIKQLFTSTSNEIVRASNQAKFFGTDVNKMFGMRRGFQQAGLNGDAFIGASGNARMALANIKDPTIFGGLTGAAQNLMVLGARTGLNINNLGDPNKALGEFTRYGKSHSQENLMQVMAAAGFDPTDAAKIKSGELKSLVDSETKKSNITAAQVKEQENLLVKMGELSSQVERVANGIAMAFTPAVIEAMDSFGKWIEAHQGDIVGFFREAGDKIKSFTDAVGGAENALKILAGLYIGKNALGLAVAGVGAGSGGKGFGALLGRLGLLGAGVYYSGDIADATTPNSVLGMRDEDKPFLYQKHWMERLLGLDYQEDIPPSARNPSGRTLADKNNNPGNIRGRNGLGGFSGYATEQEGWDAMSNQLMRYFNGQTTGKKLRTVSDIISTWAPPSENDTASYIKQVAGFVGVGENQELNLADPNVMAKLRTAMAKHEGFGNWKNGLSIGGANQFQNEYYLQQQKLANSRPPTNASNVDNSRTSSTNINTVVVNSNPQSADALTKSINQQVSRASTNAAFSSGVTP